jgi:RNA polymerase primary sigma factor
MPADVALALRIQEKDALDLIQAGREPVSLNEPAAGTENIPLEDMIADESAESPDREIDRSTQRRSLLEVVDGLKELEARVVRMYYGLGKEDPLTLEEISSRLDVSPERIRQIKESALHRLRHPSRLQRLRDAVGP